MASKADQKLEQFLKKYPERTIMWTKDHPGQEGPPIAIGKNGDLNWINREQRRALAKRKL